MKIPLNVKFQIFLWRWLTLRTILLLMLGVYAVDWFTVVAQFNVPPLVSRMTFNANFLTLDDHDEAHARATVRTLIASATRPSGPLTAESPKVAATAGPTTAPIENEAVTLATGRQGSTLYTNAFKDWSSDIDAATKASKKTTAGGLWNYFTSNQCQEEGYGAHTFGGSTERRADANLYLDYSEPFARFCIFHPRTWTPLAELPTAILLRPWLLHRFYDKKHFELCDRIPPAIAALLLAVSFLLRFLYADYDPNRLSADYPASRAGVALWAQSPFTLDANTDMSKSGKWAALLHTCEPWFPILGMLTMIVMEFVADRPETVISWAFKVPTFGLAGLLAPVMWTTISKLRSMTFKPVRFSAGSLNQVRALRPFSFGAAATLFVTVWAGMYSVFALLTSPDYRAVNRGIFQLIVVAYTLYALWQLITKINSQLLITPEGGTRAQPPPSQSNEPPATTSGCDPNDNPPSVLSSIFPAIDEITVRAILLALIPLPEILKLFS